MFSPCVNLIWLFCVFCTNSETDVRFAVALFTCCVRSLEVCLLLLSVRYGFVYMFSPCVNLIWLFCVFVPIAKRMSVAVALFTCCIRSLEVCLLLLSVRYGFVYMFSPCVILNLVILCFCTNSETDVRRWRFVYILCPFVIGLFTFFPRVFT